MIAKKINKGYIRPFQSSKCATVLAVALYGMLTTMACDNIYLPSEPPDKKIVKIIREYDAQRRLESSFVYAEDGRLTRAVSYYIDEFDIMYDRHILNIVYEGNKVKMDGLFHGRECTVHYTLASGKAVSCVFNDFDKNMEANYTFRYTPNGYLSEINLLKTTNGVETSDHISFNYSDVGNMIDGKHKRDGSHNRSFIFSYAGEENINGIAFPLFRDLFYEEYWNYEIAFYANILGKATTHLIMSCAEADHVNYLLNDNKCFYLFDSDGYVTQVITSNSKLSFIYDRRGLARGRLGFNKR